MTVPCPALHSGLVYKLPCFHNFQEHPDTVGGAMLTGVREAVRALSLLRGDDAGFGAAAADDVATGPLVKRRVVRR